MSVLATTVFWLIVASLIFSTYLLVRFIRHVKRSQLLDAKEIEALSQLAVSGSGGMGEQRRALLYVLQRKYATLKDEAAVKAGDLARAGWFVTVGLMIVFAFLVAGSR